MVLQNTNIGYSPSMSIKIIIGLGNPGKEYTKTRHNVGFLALDTLREHFGCTEWADSRYNGVISE